MEEGTKCDSSHYLKGAWMYISSQFVADGKQVISKIFFKDMQMLLGNFEPSASRLARQENGRRDGHKTFSN